MTFLYMFLTVQVAGTIYHGRAWWTFPPCRGIAPDSMAAFYTRQSFNEIVKKFGTTFTMVEVYVGIQEKKGEEATATADRIENVETQGAERFTWEVCPRQEKGGCAHG